MQKTIQKRSIYHITQKILLAYCILIGMISCRCIDIPVNDNDKPFCTAVVSYVDAKGKKMTKTLTSDNNSPLAIDLPRDSNNVKFKVSYFDKGGIKKTSFDFKIERYTSGGNIETIVPRILPATYECPKKFQLSTFGEVYKNDRSKYVKTVTYYYFMAEDYHGNSNSTKAVILQVK